jgi:Ca-activated chloride channel family protein
MQVRAVAATVDPGRDRRIDTGPHSRTSFSACACLWSAPVARAKVAPMRIAFALTCCVLAALARITAAPAANLALVLAIDVSDSVSTDRYLLQHDGIARAFETPKLLDAIVNAPGGIEVLVLEWSDPDKIAITVGWTRVGNRASAAAFAVAVRATTRTSHGLTAIGAAMRAGAAAFDHMPEPAAHKVIDVSGDGMANFGPSPAQVRDELVAQGITINGLAILTEEPWLADYYNSNVIGGASSFCLVAESMDSFADAMLKKLVQEVAGAPPRYAGENVIPGLDPGISKTTGRWPDQVRP